MSKRRLIFYNDARHYYMYCYEPPMRLEDAWAPVDEVAGTGVDTFAYGLGAGPAMLHNTKVGEVWGERLINAGKGFSQDDPSNLWALSAWRAYENARSLMDRGLDPLKVLVDRAHAKGLEFIASARMSHGLDPNDVESVFNTQVKIDHPEWCLKGRGKYCFDWVHAGVRAERFALIEETVNRYDVDGFEVDFVAQPFYFEEETVERDRHIMTEFMRDVRATLEKAAQARTRPMQLGARVLPTLAGNLAAGLDVPTWVSEGVVDFVVPNFYGDHQMDSDYPFEWLVDLAQGSDCEVYPALQARVRTVPAQCDYPRTQPLQEHAGENMGGAEHYRAGAAAYWSKGADAIYLPWFKWPVGAEQRQILSEIHDPDLLKEKTKHYVVREQYGEEFVEAHGYDPNTLGYGAELPLTLTTGLDAPGQNVRLFVADESNAAETWLRLRLMGTTTHDSLTVSLNGKALPSDTCRRAEHGGYFYTWLEYPLASDALRKGHNDVGVAVHSRPRNLPVEIVLVGVELVVDYVQPRPW